MKFAALLLIALALISAPAGCSKEQLNSSAYESMRFISNQENAQNQQYDPDRIDEYEEYRSKREGYLEDLREEPPVE